MLELENGDVCVDDGVAIGITAEETQGWKRPSFPSKNSVLRVGDE